MDVLNKKRKITQSDLRSLMQLKKKKLAEVKRKIDSPLAKYLDDGTLTCIICSSVVRSEAVWPVHINSKQHRENIVAKKKQPREKLQTESTTPVIVKKEQPVQPINPPKLKGILKNKSTERPTPTSSFVNPSLTNQNNVTNNQDINIQMEVDVEPPRNEIPEGFFDDPIMDAKARNVDYKDPIEEEWEKFQKEIKEENIVSEQIVDEDQEINAAEKEIQRIDEHMELWSKMHILEEELENVQKKTSERKNAINSPLQNNSDDADSSYGSDEEFDEYIDWRSKRSFK